MLVKCSPLKRIFLRIGSRLVWVACDFCSDSPESRFGNAWNKISDGHKPSGTRRRSRVRVIQYSSSLTYGGGRRQEDVPLLKIFKRDVHIVVLLRTNFQNGKVCNIICVFSCPSRILHRIVSANNKNDLRPRIGKCKMVAVISIKVIH